MLKLIGMVVIFLGMVSCATDYSKKKPAEIASAVIVSDSEFDAHRMFFAPKIEKSPELFLTYSTRLGASADKKTGSVFYTLSTVWEYQSSSWIFFNSADLSGGKRLESSSPIRTLVTCGSAVCTYRETINSLISLEDLAGTKDGLRIRYNSSKGSQVVEIPQNYVLGYLQGLGSLLAKQ